ncbi:NAD-dependent epimerase/dehydratase family protein [Phytoactinopolyspora halotolerans]|uniref:NAD(P)-dependent oxidoreductase n=1 Tax=Phytoactinopolyspora halotolerans TaxID=1981512 RepID=A0A6L9SCT8_9ACTN|nr:NAD(P)-dependent oxidoreductase [Phytoactinopolyspora halotolerans]NEE02402.1 NAD(P)-dependent oxidoreductase [Phytoactinopolyspora halotolerans]
MRILVTGAAGRIGRAVLQLLADEGIEASALVMNKADADDLPADRITVGDATERATVAAAVQEVDAVIHLAAIPNPLHDPPERVFAVNTQATFAVLEEAAHAGVRRAVFASSLSATGLPFAPHELHPLYLPLDEDHPDQAADAYALSKQVDEATAAMMARRHGMTIVALRYPYVASAEQLRERAEQLAGDPSGGAGDLWSYLDVRDAARAALDGVRASCTGMHRLYVAASEILAPGPTEELLRRYHPSAELRRPLPGRTGTIDTAAATRVLGFTPRHSP